ncbi:MAG: DNA-processing protein DprA [Thermoleophilia bacterium]|nr:DNA-processing protein DprA [Thermoleophilia bacterium]
MDIWEASCDTLRGWGVPQRVVAAFDDRRRSFILQGAEEAMERAGVSFVAYGTPEYPQELRHLDMPPAGLFVQGVPGVIARLRTMPRVTIVGTRKASSYGVRATEAFATAFATSGIAVISGMALGIDGRAHQATLEAGGLTVAVLGCGPDIVYPPRNRWLYEKIIAHGAVVSELPPGAPPARWTFPHRNRILAALGDAVMVVEAPRASGALQTVTWALALGRSVFSVPGSIYVENHRGCNLLLRDGAGVAVDPCVTVEDFLVQTRTERNGREPHDGSTQAVRRAGEGMLRDIGDGRDREAVLQALAAGPASVDGLIGQTGLSVRELTVALATLELDGLARRSGPGIYARAP